MTYTYDIRSVYIYIYALIMFGSICVCVYTWLGCCELRLDQANGQQKELADRHLASSEALRTWLRLGVSFRRVCGWMSGIGTGEVIRVKLEKATMEQKLAQQATVRRFRVFL